MPAPDTALLEALAPLPVRCLAAISGGRDSMALLDALVRAGKTPRVVHVDHGWRAESADDAAWVKAQATERGLKLSLGTVKAGLPRTEAAAREARWKFFAQVARRTRCPDLVLAHHADDQVETFLHQLLRGGGSGAAGMRAVTARDGLTVHRPWLGVWGRDLAAYAKRHRLSWREDATNKDERLTRNRLRRRVLPYLRKHAGEGVDAALWRAADILAAEGAWLEDLTGDAGGAERLAVRRLAAMPVAQCRRVLRQWLRHHAVPDVGYAEVEAVRALLTQRTPAKVNLPGNYHARRRAGWVFLEGG